MFKLFLILTVGIAIGYSYGWKDAQVNTQNVAERMVDRIGGANKDASQSNADIDAKMRAAESR
jgi:hypothetical protein